MQLSLHINLFPWRCRDFNNDIFYIFSTQSLKKKYATYLGLPSKFSTTAGLILPPLQSCRVPLCIIHLYTKKGYFCDRKIYNWTMKFSLGSYFDFSSLALRRLVENIQVWVRKSSLEKNLEFNFLEKPCYWWVYLPTNIHIDIVQT